MKPPTGGRARMTVVASQEALIHPRYRERLLSTAEDDTVFLDELFDVGWRKAPHRV